MWRYSIIIILFIIAFFLFREILKWLKKNGHAKIADTLSPIEKEMAKAKDEMYINGKAAVMAAIVTIAPFLIDKIIKEGPLKLIDKIFPPNVNHSFKKNGYTYIITEDKEYPFQISAEIAATAEKLTEGYTNREEKAKALFSWFQKNIPYDDEQANRIKKRQKTVYRHSNETWGDKTGVCGEQAILLIVMFRHVGIPSRYASVFKDYKGKKVCHACIYAKLDSRSILCDPAYYSFEIKHKDYKILNDVEANEHYRRMR